jgi:hypothetical protein
MPSADGLTPQEGASPQTIKRITTPGLCKAEERRAGFLVVVFHDSHRSAQSTSTAIEQGPLCQSDAL